MRENLQAGTQYGDWNGTVSADEFGDNTNSLHKLFEATGKVDPEKEIMIGFSFYWIEGSIYLSGYFHPVPDEIGMGRYPSLRDQFQAEASKPIHGKRVDAEITLEEFFKQFKRLNAVFVNPTLEIVGREIITPED